MAELPTISVADVVVNESDGTAVFVLRLSGPSALPVSVDWEAEDGTAQDTFSITDYVETNGTVTFAPGQTLQTVAISIADDDDAEAVESFQFWLSRPINAVIGNDTALGTIVDNEGTRLPRPAISVSGGTVDESDGTVSFVVRLQGPSDQIVTVDVATADGTARAGSDYQALTDTLAFLPGEVVKTVTVLLNDDNRFELTEAFSLRLSNPVGGVITSGTATATLASEDLRPAVAREGSEFFLGPPTASFGPDAVTYSLSDAGVIVNLTTGLGDRGFAEGDSYLDIDDVTGSRFNDRLTGNAFINVLSGGNGNDVLRGLDGDDELSGGSGNDNLGGGNGDDAISGGNDNDRLSGDAGNDRLGGGAGNDVLHGGSGDDVLDGGAGNDVLIGGIGIDLLRGGTGEDSFLFNNLGETGDTILDFNAANDTIDLSRMLVGFPGTLASVSRYVRLVESGNSSILQVNRDGVDDDFVDMALIRGLTGVNARQLFADDALILA